VLEIGGGIPAAFATYWMAGFGADVVRTEAPLDSLSADESTYLLTGKRRVAPAKLRELALAADIVVEDSASGSLASLGLDPTELRREKPPLVITSISPFGRTGPYAEYVSTNLVSQAMGGILSLTGFPNRPPLCNGGSQAEYLGGLNGFGASLTAYFGALLHGEGDWIDISIQECAAGMLEYHGPLSAAEGDPSPRAGNQVNATWGVFPCADGFAAVCALARQIPAFFSLLGDPELEDERFTDPLQRLENNDELEAKVWVWFSDKTQAELLELGEKHRVPLGVVRTPRELLESTALAERGFFDEVETSSGCARVPGRPFLGLAWRGGTLHAPATDTEHVYRDWFGESP
jgi:crotonobetainyl-CoA:carnitine CoA-transferase CaiB-like acyl-CoA transferase